MLNVCFFLIDINECENGQDNCSANSECENILGDFNCPCNHNFVRVGTECLSKSLKAILFVYYIMPHAMVELIVKLPMYHEYVEYVSIHHNSTILCVPHGNNNGTLKLV